MSRVTPCRRAGCEKHVRSNQPTGLCKAHYGEEVSARAPKCGSCGKLLRNRTKLGLCADCRAASRAKECVKCGVSFLDHRPLRSGMCRPCDLTMPSIRSVPLDRRPDYNLLRGRGMSAQEAADHINAGKPVERLYRGGTLAKVTTMDALRAASAALDISQRDVLSCSRFREAVDCRAVVVEVMTRQGVSYAQIGRRLGRDHSSIINLHRGFADRASLRPVLAKVVEHILERAA